MIRANELRIGNLVQVLGIYKDSFRRAGLITVDAELMLLCEQNKIGILPIPLTPEILEKCEFKHAGGSRYFIPRTAAFGLELLIIGDEIIFQFQDYEIKLKYLHQLQNLYFVLTGEELPINLNSPATIHNQS